MTDSIKVWVYSVQIRSGGWLSGQAGSSLEPEKKRVLLVLIFFFICGFITGHCSSAVLGLYFRGHGLNICSKLCPNGETSQTPGFQSAGSASHLECSVFSPCNCLFCFLQVALLHCSSQLIINSPLLHCPTFAPGRLLKFYFIIYSNLMHRGLFI